MSRSVGRQLELRGEHPSELGEDYVADDAIMLGELGAKHIRAQAARSDGYGTAPTFCNDRSTGAVEDSHFLLELCAEVVSFDLEIIARLEIEPETIARAEIPRQPQRCVG